MKKSKIIEKFKKDEDISLTFAICTCILILILMGIVLFI